MGYFSPKQDNQTSVAQSSSNTFSYKVIDNQLYEVKPVDITPIERVAQEAIVACENCDKEINRLYQSIEAQRQLKEEKVRNLAQYKEILTLAKPDLAKKLGFLG